MDLAKEIVQLSKEPNRPSQLALVICARRLFDFRNEDLDPYDTMIVHAPIEEGQLVFRIISSYPHYEFKYNARSNIDGAATCVYGFLMRNSGDYIRLVGYSQDVRNMVNNFDHPISEWNVKVDRSGEPEATMRTIQMVNQILKTLLVM